MIDLKRILLPTDFSDTSLAAANYAIALAEKFSAEVHLVHVIEELHTTIPLLETYGAPTKEEYEAKAQAMLDNWPLPDGAENLTIVRRFHHGSPYVQLLRDARDHDIDLIVIGTHGRGLTAHLLMGNVAERVVRKASCPVLTVRPDGHQFVHPGQE
ncbi:universal stress protein [Thalassoroseus pseudoceratinae]|uniref:universal stress protein n=1 Tax=Thalassoroseus pseudoceratinae TaxID=2713176 RepID=UPI00141F9641|nr:universal stress protein [Thalassoroseus pseudoceratinae]